MLWQLVSIYIPSTNYWQSLLIVNIYWAPLCMRLTEHFVHVTSCNPHNNSRNLLLSLSPFYRWSSWGLVNLWSLSLPECRSCHSQQKPWFLEPGCRGLLHTRHATDSCWMTELSQIDTSGENPGIGKGFNSRGPSDPKAYSLNLFHFLAPLLLQSALY